MKVKLLSESKQAIGGGFSFIGNFKTGALNVGGIETVEDWESADIVLIPSSSMVSKEMVRRVKDAGKKIVLRIDNIPRNSRNRNTGTSHLKLFSELADLVIYQSRWAREYIRYFTNVDGRVIYNGIDTQIFRPEGTRNDYSALGNRIYCYSRYNRDDSKNWIKVWYEFQMIARHDPLSGLVIVGQFSPEIVATNFDFFMNEKIHYEGIIASPEQMARILRGCHVLLAPYQYDAYSNTIQEGLACNLEIGTFGEMSGGTPELLEIGVRSKEKMVEQYRDVISEEVMK